MPRKRTVVVEEETTDLPEEELEDEELDEEEDEEEAMLLVVDPPEDEELVDLGAGLLTAEPGSLNDGDPERAYDAEKARAGFVEALVAEAPREYRLELFEPGDQRIQRRQIELVKDGWEWPAVQGFRPPARKPFLMLVVSRDKA